MVITDFTPRGARAFPRRFFGTLDETTGGSKILHPREALDIMHLVEPHEAEDLAKTGHGVHQISGVGSMVCGRLDHREFAVAQPLVVISDQGPVDFDALVSGGISQAFGHAITGRVVGDLLANLGEVVWSCLALPP